MGRISHKCLTSLGSRTHHSRRVSTTDTGTACQTKFVSSRFSKTETSTMFLKLALLCVLMTALTPVTSTSDPMAELCDTACWEEGVLVDQCITNLTCDVDSSISDAEFEACRQPCWDIAGPCRQQCRQWYHGALRRCSTSTGGRDSHNRLCAGWRRRFPGWAHHGCDGSTFMDCVLDFMMRSRARWLISSTRREQ